MNQVYPLILSDGCRGVSAQAIVENVAISANLLIFFVVPKE